MDYKSLIDKNKLPEHIAIIMDGNGRWAKKRGNVRVFGHQNAVKSVRNVVEASVEIGVKYLTLYTFSSENWKRPKIEVNALMGLLVSSLNSEIKTLTDNNVRLLAIGDLNQLPGEVNKKLIDTIELTSKNKGLNLILALSYSSRSEILRAAINLAGDVKNNTINISDIDDSIFNKYLYTAHIPDPELLIRTSGELRISNFLLYQLAYSELYFTKTLWPDFSKEEFFKAIHDFQSRERRFGLTSEQLKKMKRKS